MAPDERRQAIIEAVVPLLLEHGGGVTTRQIAEAAGVAEGTIFRVFPDKCALMMAAAESRMDPVRGRESLLAIDPHLDLPDTVVAMARLMLDRMHEVSAVMLAARQAALSRPEVAAARAAEEGQRRPFPGPGDRPGPPPFIVEANRALLDALTELFARHRDELAVPPERAALALRSLVFGSGHPGMGVDQPMTAEEIARVLVSGVGRS